MVVSSAFGFGAEEFAEFHLENGIGEELHGVHKIHGLVQISRHRANCGITEPEEWIEANVREEFGYIEISKPTIG